MRGRPRQAILAAYDHLASLAACYGGLETEDAARAVELFHLTGGAGDADLAAELFASLHARGNLGSYYPRSQEELALRLCRERPERFADVLAALAEQEDDRGELTPAGWPEPVLGPLGTGALGELVREAIVTRQLALLVACGTKSVLLDAAGVRPLPQPVVREEIEEEGVAPAWLERYPPSLHPALRRLAVAGSEAPRWLAAGFPDPARLEREIAAVELRLLTIDPAREPALRIRLGNLRKRLDQPATPSPARLENLGAKLDRAWGRAVLERWERDLDALLPQALRRLLEIEGIETLPPWLSEPETLMLLAAATRMEPPHRRLALRLFRLRYGPPPWDLRDAPENRSFLESLPEIDWSPWLDGVGEVEIEANGRRLHLALEDDPLEIFRMGARFQTCLSPGQMSYFSVFANAADIDKRLLYARDGAGQVAGRCLLGLTAEGSLLTFEPYCHDGGLGFGKICADFADELARRMRTRRTGSGRVPLLVAAAWYDDGARDLSRLYAALEEGSAFRRRLATVPPDGLLDELRRALEPARLDAATLPMVLALPELQERPELAVPLLWPVAETRALPDDSLLNAAQLGVRAGAADLVRRLLLRPLTDLVSRACRAEDWADRRITGLLLRFDPARLLAILRATRGRSVRHWLDETEADRLESAAAALGALHRPRQARRSGSAWRRAGR
jgi:hypothetical protein